MLFFFSGTGNSRYVARKIAEVTGDSLLNLNEQFREKASISLERERTCIFVFPTYAWRIPRIVEKWIRETQVASNVKAWFVMTCGDEIGNAGKYNESLCRDKHFTYMGTAQIVMPENYIAMFAVPKPSTAQKIIEKAEPVISNVADMLRAQALLKVTFGPYTDNPKGFGKPPWYRAFRMDLTGRKEELSSLMQRQETGIMSLLRCLNHRGREYVGKRKQKE